MKFQIKAIEDAIDLGQIEEVIEMAKDELHLIDYYYGESRKAYYNIIRFSVGF